ncbi:muts domain V-domain-containing protein [Gymnopilus junonius]|uniref:Muts domain V-domain-containing protein n=1 Tax=Gymnopilus junonius TaxID=109634 RepID=A0A9P5P224_GYMJU|nr:muts domain V-domain-containing protein [Gymnopilus junonius]
MVLTRLSSISRKNAFMNALSIPRTYLTRHIASSTSSNVPDESTPDPAPPKKPRKTTKKYLDLPNAYTSPTGATAAPLKAWPANDFSLSLEEESVATEVKRRPRRVSLKKAGEDPEGKIRSKKISKEDKVDEQSSQKKSSTKVPKPTTFLSRQILANLKRFPHCLLLTRVGQFYESYFDQAVEISHLLNIKLTSRKWNGERVAMCGFPLLHLDKHLKTLVQQEQRFVAMCEEFSVHTSPNSKEFERRITRIITPGTLIDESFIIPTENNYLLAISTPRVTNGISEPLGLAWIDVSTGEFFYKQCELQNLRDELARIAPREIVLEASLKEQLDNPIYQEFIEGKFLVSYTDPFLSSSESPYDFNLEIFPHAEQPTVAVGLEPIDGTASSGVLAESLLEPSTMPQHSLAVNLLTKFLRENLLEHMPDLDSPLHESTQDRMQIDLHTIQGLEIRESSDGSAKGSMLSVVKRTVTSGGARLLARWLCSPSTSIQEINFRQNLVAFFRSRVHFRMDVCDILKQVDDIGRLCQKFLLGRASFDDLVAIRANVDLWASLKKCCDHEKSLENLEKSSDFQVDQWSTIDALFLRLTDLHNLSDSISKAITTDPTSSTEEPDMVEDVQSENNVEEGLHFTEKSDSGKWKISPLFSEELKALHDARTELLKQKDDMEQFLRHEYRAPSLTLRSSPGQGMFIHLARAKRDKKKLDNDPIFYSIGESITTKSYIYRDWSELGNKIAETELSIAVSEKQAFELLRLGVVEHAHQLRKNAQVIDELDVAMSFAVLAEQMNFVRPEVVDDGSYHVVNGRHPSVEMGLLSLGRQFAPNTVEMVSSSSLHLITGPNMAGKSTLLRQTALIAILAQVGSCVPADYARIGIVDKLFSRIGAKDDLFRDRSTFMVEMLETADILRRATDKSLVIMDEVGRGTTVKDGLAIAFATIHHLVTSNKCRCLFATHFHELTDMVGNSEGVHGTGLFHNVHFYCSDVDEVGEGHFTYSHRLRPGINRDSHGLKVARLAGIPSSAIDVAANTLSWLKGHGLSSVGQENGDFFRSILESRF